MKFTLLLSLTFALNAHALDQNANQQSDIWEIQYGALGLTALTDTDGDGFTNAMESVAGTNPFDAASYPKLSMSAGLPGEVNLQWPSEAGKNYTLFGSTNLSTFAPLDSMMGDGSTMLEAMNTNGQPRYFFKLQPLDVDSDSDGLSDWEEIKIGFNPKLNRTDRTDSAADLSRVQSTLNAASVITVGLVDGDMREDWPDKGVVVIRRSGGLKPLNINLTFVGTATRNSDYSANIVSTQIVMPFGAREAWVELSPINDATSEGLETIVVTATIGTGYTLGTITSASATLGDASSLPSAKAAARFLIQASFGPDQDDTLDADDIPENVEQLMSVGFDAWFNDQTTRPIGYLQPYTNWAVTFANPLGIYGNYKQHAWWSRAMGAPKLRPDAVTTQLPDPLRQRVAFALSEILVVSDRPETLGVFPEGMAQFYDLFETHAFGNYATLLKAVTLHPVMGVYLSHLGNQKANVTQNLHPDENFAREIMQLFTIGLWELNLDGSRKVDAQGRFIPTYSNSDITELARVFTGLTWGDSSNFNPNNLANGDQLQPMKCWDAVHDCNPKTLLGGLQTPLRTASATNLGTAGMADVDAAVANLFNHPNVGPFIAIRLIQRFVTSNPSPAYIARVATKFNNNGSGVRGDLKAVMKAILLDTEARDPANMESSTFGKLREPFLRVVNLARAFNASSPSGLFVLDQFVLDHMQDPMNSPSVFNYFLPNHSPPGPLSQQGYVAPEFQVLNATSAITGANYFYNVCGGSDIHRWGQGNAQYSVKLNLAPELAMVVPSAQVASTSPTTLLETDTLIRHLDLTLLGGTLSPRQFQIMRESVARLNASSGVYQWHRERLKLLVTMFVTSAEFNVLR
jgi:uncharacterized protein (DUF1800 family)